MKLENMQSYGPQRDDHQRIFFFCYKLARDTDASRSGEFSLKLMRSARQLLVLLFCKVIIKDYLA